MFLFSTDVMLFSSDCIQGVSQNLCTDVHVFDALSLRAAVVGQQCCVLPQDEPRPVSDRLPGVLHLRAAHAVQQTVYGETGSCLVNCLMNRDTQDQCLCSSSSSSSTNESIKMFFFLSVLRYFVPSMTGTLRRPQWWWIWWRDLEMVRNMFLLNGWLNGSLSPAHVWSLAVPVCGFPDGFTGIYSSQLSPQCWSADSQRIIIACPQRSRKVQSDPGKQLLKPQGCFVLEISIL